MKLVTVIENDICKETFTKVVRPITKKVGKIAKSKRIKSIEDKKQAQLIKVSATIERAMYKDAENRLKIAKRKKRSNKKRCKKLA